MAEVDIPGDLILPEPKNDRERDIFNAIQDAFRQQNIALRQISELL